ncbi:MAG: sensor histidine kinase [Dehalococcoidia bacterium]|nr:sensor histidine kinase [Dehalococcoidia bacterium]
MNAIVKDLTQRTKEVVLNRHLWGIACILVALILFYNASYLGTAGWLPWLKKTSTGQDMYLFIQSFLFLIPILYASAVFRLRGTLVTWLLFMVATLPRALYESPDVESLLRVVIFALVALVVALLIVLELNQRQKMKEALKPMETGQWNYVARILEAQEYERQHVARELHDNTIQALLVIANRAHALEIGDYGPLSPEARRQTEEIMVMILHAIEDVRRLSRDLRPSILDDIGLLPALRWLGERSTQESGIGVETVVNGTERRLPPEAEVVVFRVAQEALNNVGQHSSATSATVTLDFLANSFRITVHDNGKGFSLPRRISDLVATGKLGLGGMQQRAKLLDGTFSIRSQPGKGTTLTVEAGG